MLQTEVITFSSALSGETERLVPEEMPVIHTEMKTITYEALQVHSYSAGIRNASQHILACRQRDSNSE